MRWRWALAASAVLMLGLAFLAYRMLSRPGLPEGVLYANGQLEAVDVRISAQVTGRVVASRLVEGRRVERGALLVRIDPADLNAQLAKARAQSEAIQQRRRALDELLRTWRHHLQTARAELHRARTLQRENAASEQRVDQAENAYEEARGRVGALEAQLAEAAAELEAATNEAHLLEIQLARTRIEAPISGTVLTKGIEVGELATPGRLVALLANLSELELRVFVPERELGKIALGDPARARIDAFPERTFPGRVARIDEEAQFTPREVHMPDERARTVFGVIIVVPNEDGMLKSGMPADAWIRWREDAAWPDRLVVPRS